MYKKLIWLTTILLTSFAGNALEINGQWQQGELIIAQTEPGSSAVFQGKPIMVADDGLFIIGLDRDEDSQASLQVTTPDGNTQNYNYPIKPREYKIQRVEGIAKNIMQPSEADRKRASREAVAIRKARAKDSWRRDFLDQFIRPVEGPTSGVYGSQRYYNGKPGRPHYGWDIAAPTGTPVKAPAAGKVIFAQLDTFYSGGLIIIDHGFQLSSSFLHLSDIAVEVGDLVEAGQHIGDVGATGRVTGPHLDWRMNWGKSRIDPQRLIETTSHK